MKKLFTTKNLALMAIFAAIAAILMLLIEIPVVFIAPSFYKLDFSEITYFDRNIYYGTCIRNNYGSYKDCA